MSVCVCVGGGGGAAGCRVYECMCVVVCGGVTGLSVWFCGVMRQGLWPMGVGQGGQGGRA